MSASFLEGEGESVHHARQGADHGDRGDDAVLQPAHVEILPASRRVCRGEIAAEHIRDRHPHLVAGTCVANHRADHIARFALAPQGVDRTDRDGLLTGSEPGLGDDALLDPPLERDVVKAETKQAAVESEQIRRAEPTYLGLPLRLFLDPAPVPCDQLTYSGGSYAAYRFTRSPLGPGWEVAVHGILLGGTSGCHVSDQEEGGDEGVP